MLQAHSMLRVSGTTIALVWSTFVDLPSSRPKERIEPISIGRSLVLRESLRVFRFSFSTRVHRTNVRRVFQLPVPHTHTHRYIHTLSHKHLIKLMKTIAPTQTGRHSGSRSGVENDFPTLRPNPPPCPVLRTWRSGDDRRRS